MPYVIIETCATEKAASCVAVCPVDCIHPTPDEDGYDEAAQLYIDPDECIECDACVSECPVDAVMAAELVPPGSAPSIERNAAYFR